MGEHLSERAACTKLRRLATLVAAGKLRIVLAAFEPPPAPVQLVHLPGMQSRSAVEFSEFAAAALRTLLA